eukprot:TRINITY_DN60359_c0_g1_i1.p1 TRINITY_DN60359_c0_g1~~TRINITY_DN60359_c0_g1_i1.p1  ORF type:complete len:527 (-),score=38.90 TRINITY_DN60359_c0_g1_i1:38-1618(-)
MEGRAYSREELYDACFPWTIIDDQVYNLHGFLEEHPGGALIKRAIGEDASALFSTHHSGRTSHRAAHTKLKELWIGQLKNTGRPQPLRKGPFQDALNERIGRLRLDKRPAWPVAEAVAVAMLGLFVCWAVLCYLHGDWRMNVAFAWFWWRHFDSGLHAAAHGDFRFSETLHRWLFTIYGMLSHKATGYYYGDASLRGVGMTKHLWHHVYTNDPERDPDWSTMSGDAWVRRHISSAWHPYNAKQKHYWLLVTATVEPCLELLTAFMHCLENTAPLLEAPTRGTPPFLSRLKTAVAAWTEILCNPGYQGLAFFFQPWWHALGTLLLARAVSRLVLFPFSEVQHYMPEIIPDTHTQSQQNDPEEWAVVQLRTTANLDFGPVAWLVDFLMFHGDSHQIEHHLWPAMSFVNYRRAGKLVKETCKEFDVPYHEFTYWQGYARIWKQVCDHSVPAAVPVAATPEESDRRNVQDDDVDSDSDTESECGPQLPSSLDGTAPCPRKRKMDWQSSSDSGSDDLDRRAPRRRRSGLAD